MVERLAMALEGFEEPCEIVELDGQSCAMKKTICLVELEVTRIIDDRSYVMFYC
jgi:hypothetical protein